MATVKLQNGKVILKNGKVSCSCCGCPYPFDFFTLLLASQMQINENDNSFWPGDVTVSEWTQIANIDEEPTYSGSFSPPILSVFRSEVNYRFNPKLGNGNGECARFVCTRSKSTNSMTVYGGPTTTDRDLRQLIANYVPNDIWGQNANFLFKIEFYAWYAARETQSEEPRGGGIFYNFYEPSDTKFTIKYATFTINQ